MAHSIPLPPGTSLKNGAYRLAQNIGRGGLGLVYRAASPEGKAYAIKECYDTEYTVRAPDGHSLIIRTDVARAAAIHTHQCKRAHEEVRRFSAPGLRHPALVPLLESFDENGTTYIVMPLLEGISLQQVGEWPESRDPAWILAVLRQLAEALSQLHRNRLIHRDLKPDNVILVGKRDAPQPVLLDTGAARSYSDARQLHTGIATDFGSPEIYSAAEARRFGAPGPASDCFSLAGIAYWLLSGVKPENYLRRSSVIERRQPDPLLRPATLPIPAWEVLRPSLALNVAEREANAVALINRLASVLAAGTATADPDVTAETAGASIPPTSKPSVPPPCRRPAVTAGEDWIIALALTAAAGMLLYVLIGPDYGPLAVLAFLAAHVGLAVRALLRGASPARALWPGFNLYCRSLRLGHGRRLGSMTDGH